MNPRSRCPIAASRVVSAVIAAACVAHSPACTRDGAQSEPTQLEVIRRDQLAVLSIDNGRTRVLYTSSLVEPGAVGYQALGPLLVFAYDEVQPGSGFDLHSHDNVEVLTIVLEGSFDQEDTAGQSGRVNTGEMSLMSAGSGVKHAEFGAPDAVTRSVTIWVKPRTMNKAPHRAVGKPVEMKNGWQLIAAEHAAPLIIEQDVRVLMRRLSPGERVTLIAQSGRMIYLAPVEGELLAGDQRLIVPERAILRDSKIGITSDAGAMVVLVDAPLTQS